MLLQSETEYERRAQILADVCKKTSAEISREVDQLLTIILDRNTRYEEQERAKFRAIELAKILNRRKR